MPHAVDGLRFEGCDAKKFSVLAERHKVKATALAGLRMLGAKAPKLELKELAKSAAFEFLLRKEMTRQWLLVVKALETAGIRCLSLKGPALSLQLYGDPYAREFTDIDIIVDKTSAAVLDPIMETLGFLPGEGDTPAEFSDNPIFQSGHHIVYWRKDRIFRFELHASGRIGEATAYGATISDLFERAETISWEGERIRTLSEVDHRLFALAHGIQHEWCALHWLVDGARIICADSQGHEELAQAISKYGMEREFAVSRSVVELAFGIKAGELLAAVKPPFFNPRGPAEYCYARLFSQASPRLIDTFNKIARFDLPLAAGFQAKLKRLGAPWKVPAHDAARQRLPKKLYVLHLALRPFNVVGRRISRLVQKFSGDYPPGEILGTWFRLAYVDLRLRILPYPINRRFIFDPAPMGDQGERRISEEDKTTIEHLSGVVKRAASHPFCFNMTCLRRSIALRALLARKGIKTLIVFGVQKKGRPGDRFPGHAWLRAGNLDIDTYAINSGIAVFSVSSPAQPEGRTP
jgi:hypothetical protein